MAAGVKHGKWTYCVDLTPDEGRRRTRRRGGFATRAEAARKMAAVLDGELRGMYENRRTTVASFLRKWLVLQKVGLAPNTYAGYKACVERDLIPAFGHHRLLDLRPKHIDEWITAQLDAGRGRVTVYRTASTLRNALNAAVCSWRLRYNPAKHSVPPKHRAAERTCWPPDEAAAFLRHGAEQYADQLTDLFEVMLGNGMRCGEALALPTSTSWTAGSTSAGPSPPSTRGRSTSGNRRPRPAASGAASYSASWANVCSSLRLAVPAGPTTHHG
ncbi:site-specific integrase [Kitasatospora griseola]|uniref:site-specific integrase n=1 Tax=Kitasatospora griseola TaxID=2064 RepID=UPI00382FB357